jgi:uncharacterized damage-inducible protein DinB
MLSEMSLKKFLHARLDCVRHDLWKVIEGCSNDELNFAPVAGMRTIKGMLVEIGATELDLLSNLNHILGMPYREAETYFAAACTVGELRLHLEEVRSYTLDFIAELSDDDLQQEIPVRPDTMQGMGLASVPRCEVIRTIAQHEWYHTGQLVSYFWAKGKNPYT